MPGTLLIQGIRRIGRAGEKGEGIFSIRPRVRNAFIYCLPGNMQAMYVGLGNPSGQKNRRGVILSRSIDGCTAWERKGALEDLWGRLLGTITLCAASGGTSLALAVGSTWNSETWMDDALGQKYRSSWLADRWWQVKIYICTADPSLSLLPDGPVKICDVKNLFAPRVPLPDWPVGRWWFVKKSICAVDPSSWLAGENTWNLYLRRGFPFPDWLTMTCNTVTISAAVSGDIARAQNYTRTPPPAPALLKPAQFFFLWFHITRYCKVRDQRVGS